MAWFSTIAHDWSVLRYPLFAALWTSALFSNTGTLIREVGVTWLMTSLAPSPMMVALIQTAETVPYFLMALPAGALADLIDRRRLALFSQAWMFAVAAVLGVMTLQGRMTPVLLLCLTALMGLGNALSGPVYQAIIYEVVPVIRLPSAITLNSASFNLARAIGPALGGLLVAAAGTGATFLVTAATFLGVMAVLYNWRRPPVAGGAPRTPLLGAMWAGIQHARSHDRLRFILIRVCAFTIGASAFWALLPLVARLQLQVTATGYGLLFAFFGLGAVGITALLPAARRQLSEERLVQGATVSFAVSLFVLATSSSLAVAAGAMLFAGGTWLLILTTFNMAVHISAAEWVRGRALALYFMVLFGAMAGGSALWGAVAEAVGVGVALQVAAGAIVLSTIISQRYRLSGPEVRTVHLAMPSRPGR